ncbi:PQQ-binding-like beta-propeller repeat protein [Kitasatospora sp. NPDC053057]|uniref:protein kinase domain-containing protein n=1 Tax=Kitasatospora sp. NPDC053057 TaxID=3364062 RepID=UPI0037CCBF7F
MEPLNSTDPETVGPYRLIARLGAGGMGQVYLARSTGGRTVAVKVVRPELAQDQEFRVRFRREVAAARAVDGAYTAPVTDADPDGPTPWLATAYVLGPSLTEAVHEHGPLPEPSVRALGARLAEALEAIHGAALVHRDLKPSNVLLAADGPRVIDFGIARAMDGDSMTQTGTVVGSPGFMSPEQASGRPTGAPGDVFSLASVLVFAATGHGPFDSASGVAAQLYKVVHEEPDLTDVPPALRAILEHCLRKDPALRPLPAHLRAWLATGTPTTEWLPTPVAAALARHAAAVMNLDAPLRTPVPQPVPHVAYGPPSPYVPTQLGTPRPTTPRPTHRGFLLAGGALAATAAVGGTTWALTRPGKPGGQPSGTSSAGPAPAPVWTYKVSEGTQGGHAPYVAGEFVFVNENHVLTALSRIDGSVRAQADHYYESNGYLTTGNEFYAWMGGTIMKPDLDDLNEVNPRIQSFTDYGGGRTVAVDQGLAATTDAVFATVQIQPPLGSGSRSGPIGIMAFQHGLAKQLWFQEDPDLAGLGVKRGVIGGGTLLYLDNANRVVARRLADGSRLWRVETGSTDPWTVAADEERAYCPVNGRDIQAIGLADGKPQWRITRQGSSYGAVLATKDVLYAGDGTDSVSAFDPVTGKARWTCPLPGAPAAAAAPVLAKGTLFVPGRYGDYGIHAIDATTGRLKWTYKDPDYTVNARNEREAFFLSTDGSCVFGWLRNKITALPAV